MQSENSSTSLLLGCLGYPTFFSFACLQLPSSLVSYAFSFASSVTLHTQLVTMITTVITIVF